MYADMEMSMATFKSFQELQKAAHLKTLSDNCPSVAVDPSGDDPTSLTVESTAVDVADCAIDNGVNPEEQVGETTSSLPLSIESQAQADVGVNNPIDSAEASLGNTHGSETNGVDPEVSADASVTPPPDTQSEALDADNKHTDTAPCACEDNANVTTETDAQSPQTEKTTPDDGVVSTDATEASTTTDLVPMQTDKDSEKQDKTSSKKPYSPWLPPAIYANLLQGLKSESKTVSPGTGGVVLAGNAGVLVSEALSKAVTATTEEDSATLPRSDADNLKKAGDPDSSVFALPCLPNPATGHQSLKLECSAKLLHAMSAHEKAIISLGFKNTGESKPQDEAPVSFADTLVNDTLHSTKAIMSPYYYQKRFFNEEFLTQCEPKSESEGYFVRRTTPEFPTHILYPWMQKYVKSISSALNIHEAAPAFAIYGLGSACIRGTAVLELKNQNNRKLYCNVWITFTALPGNKKSGLFKLVFHPVQDLQDNMALEAMELYDAGNPRNWQRITIGEFTRPALAEILTASPDGITILTCEIAGLLQSCHNVQYRSDLCTMYDGDPWTPEKKQKKPLYIPRALVSIIGCIPMKLLVKPYTKFEPSGFTDRFIFVPLSSNKPNFIGVQPDLTDAKLFFQKCVDVLVSHTGSNVPPTVYNVSDEAWDLYSEWANHYELELFDTPYHQCFQKTKDQVLKLSHSGHILDTRAVKNVTDLTVSKYDMSIACGIGSWIVEYSKELHNLIYSKGNFDLSKFNVLKTQLLNVIQINSYRDDKGNIKISNYDIFKNMQTHNEEDVKNVFKSLGLEATTSCKQSNGKFGRGQLVPPELLTIC